MSIRVPLNLVVACEPDGLILHPGGYRLSLASLKKDRGLKADLETIVRNHALIDPMIRPIPRLMFLVEPGGDASYLEARKQTGFGRMRDSTEIRRLSTTAAVFDGFSSAKVTRGAGPRFIVTLPAGAGRCTAIVWIDGRRADFDILSGYYPDDLALVEVYPQRTLVPSEFVVPGASCGAIVVWTKYALK